MVVSWDTRHPLYTEFFLSHFPLFCKALGELSVESGLSFVLATAVSTEMSSLRAQGNGLDRDCSQEAMKG
jgi:hypothetical protein